LLSPVVLAALLVMLALVVIPASEAQVATTRTIDVDNTDDDNPAAGCTLREAIDVANAGIGAGMAANGCTVVESGTGMSITYKINLPSYTYTLSGTAGNDDNTGGDLDIMANVMIMGMGAGSTIIDGNGIDRVFHLPIAGLGITLHISDVTIQNGYVAGNENGGGIHNNGGAVNISNSIIVNNRAGDEGGGIFNWAGRLIISDCTISNNESQGAWGGRRHQDRR
jgi:CSLREA domain-containing protein